MADISRINNGTTTYDVKDATARTYPTDLTNNLVHKSGAETITGTKTFSNVRGIISLVTGFKQSETPTSTIWGDQFVVLDEDGLETFILENSKTTSGDQRFFIVNKVGSASRSLGISFDGSSGTVITTAEKTSGSAFAAAAMPFVYSSSTDEYINNVIDFTTTTQQDVTAGNTKNRWLCVQASFSSDAFISFTINKVGGDSSSKMYFYRKDFKAGAVDGFIIPIPAGAYVFVTKQTIPSTVLVNRIIYCDAEV